MHIKRDISNWNIKIILSVLIGAGNPELLSKRNFDYQWAQVQNIFIYEYTPYVCDSYWAFSVKIKKHFLSLIGPIKWEWVS